MDQQQARSLYGQNSFDVKFPTYLPTTYRYICGLQYDGFMLAQTYWNKSRDAVLDIFHNGEYEYFEDYVSHGNALQAGIVQIWSMEAGDMYHPEANNTGYERLNQITKPENRYYVEPRIVQISTDPEVSAISYKRFDDLDINILEIYDRIRNEAYFIKAKMPLAEVTRVAQSMFSK